MILAWRVILTEVPVSGTLRDAVSQLKGTQFLEREFGHCGRLVKMFLDQAEGAVECSH